ncbi:MAG: PH domain-containing protein [Gemmatimonadetes bacterium]|nr:PH domain-containing protein [Gemmatimonadota bacterium]MYB97670.1 PH domain-containing protein [Gemmatimonadota bacterium]MYI46727.1 PH domain-containing protein [Gemmatimonadota bacterium]
MSRSDPGAWQRTSPFAIVFFIGRTIKSFTRSLIQLVATFGALAVLIERNPQVALVIPVGILAIIVAGVLEYWFFRFRIEEDRIHIHQGIARKTALDLPFDRVQGINVERSLIDRILGLVTVSLDTAGSATAEGQLPSVTSELADDLRTRIRAHRPATVADGIATADEQAEEATPAAEESGRREPSPGQVILKLTSGDIARIGFSNRNLVVAAAVLGLLGQSLDFAEDRLRPIFESAGEAFAGAGALIQVLVVIGFVLVGLGLVLFGALLRYHGFTLWREGTAYRTRAGLLTQREVVVEARKIQQLTLSHNLVMRLFRRHRLRALPAALLPNQGGADAAGLQIAEVLEVPLLRARQAEDLRTRVFGREGDALTLQPRSPAFLRVSPVYIRALTLRISFTGALVALPFLVPLLQSNAGTNLADAVQGLLGETPMLGAGSAGTVALGVLLWWLVLIPPAALIAWVRWRRQGYLHDDDGLASRSGFLGRKVDAFLFRKAQSVAVVQSPLQRRKGLATLNVQLACGPLSVPYIDHGIACRLRDYMLYRVESSRRRWH